MKKVECFRQVDGHCIRWVVPSTHKEGKRIAKCPVFRIMGNVPHDGFYRIACNGDDTTYSHLAYDVTSIPMDEFIVNYKYPLSDGRFADYGCNIVE